jgi:hypothetical protein
MTARSKILSVLLIVLSLVQVTTAVPTDLGPDLAIPNVSIVIGSGEEITIIPNASAPSELGPDLADLPIIVGLEDNITIDVSPDDMKLNEFDLLQREGMELKPASLISVEIKHHGKPTKISIARELENVTINVSGISARTPENMKIENEKIAVVTSTGIKEIKVLPDELVVELSKETRFKEQNIEDITLKVENEMPVYNVKSKVPVKILGLIPAEMNIKAKIDAQTGRVLRVDRPWWHFFTTR